MKTPLSLPFSDEESRRAIKVDRFVRTMIERGSRAAILDEFHASGLPAGEFEIRHEMPVGAVAMVEFMSDPHVRSFSERTSREYVAARDAKDLGKMRAVENEVTSFIEKYQTEHKAFSAFVSEMNRLCARAEERRRKIYGGRRDASEEANAVFAQEYGIVFVLVALAILAVAVKTAAANVNYIANANLIWNANAVTKGNEDAN